MNDVNVIGIDPGLSGALAIMYARDANPLVTQMPVVHISKQGKNRREYFETEIRILLLGAMTLDAQEPIAFIERQQAMPKQGVSSSFKCGDGYGLLRGILVGLGFGYEIVHPRVWKRAMGVTSDKGSSRIVASRLFPGVELGRRKDEGMAEALLIAEYGRRLLAGQKR